MKIYNEEQERLQKIKSTIKNDFDRFVELEKSYIINVSHIVLPWGEGALHEDRKNLRKELFEYLNTITGMEKRKCANKT
jgi:wyosine [tRNA(Phe)-imidazoG37] synthetase (radical SAM superfamily)